MSEPARCPAIAVVIATKDRTGMLSERALTSVVSQTRRPDHLVIVDDSSPDVRPLNSELVASLKVPGCGLIYVENRRTEGASGGWNSALDYLLASVEDPRRLFVAVLDDDDAWAPTYLEQCFAAACSEELDMVAADLRRFESVDDPPVTGEGPALLRADDFLTGNPGIQGSNLFVRLSVLLAAGGFDEALRSTTDRDLAIRIADLGSVRYGRLPVALVDHYADPNRSRLSTRGSHAKLDGLTAFWRKYVGRMTPEQRSDFSARAAALFDWRRPQDPVVPGTPRLAQVLEQTLVLPLAADNQDLAEMHERVAIAELWTKRRFSPERVRLLGVGSEAVVFTDDRTVYKCFDGWKTRLPQSQIDFLRAQVGRWGDTPGLYALRDVVEDGTWVVLTYDYEESAPYEGGHEADVVRLLDGCCAVGIVCNNFHPKNVVTTGAGVKLIDYGADIRPWSPTGFEHMARRAFLASRHAAHPELHVLMRRALSDEHMPELAGYPRFREQLVGSPTRAARLHAACTALGHAPAHSPLHLYVGVITSDPAMLRPLLRGLASLGTSGSTQQLAALVLDNGCPAQELDDVIRMVRDAGLKVAVVDEAQQSRDAAVGAFGASLRARPPGQVGIARARTMLQRYLGALLASDGGSFGWLLDDDMRVDARASAYLPWLPVFREQGTDVLIGAYEGVSPNPPLNGLRVHLVDLFHNLLWLRGLSDDAILPDRAVENAALRARFPDYYYDLSRKHTGHLEMPHWLEPAFAGETVGAAYSRLLTGALGILSGAPLTRPIVASVPSDPLASAKDSVNRGGCTFILNHQALTQTPNTTTLIQGREARRSDMIWAIVNRYYRRMTIKAVGFPIQHVGRVQGAPSLNVEKVQAEIVGSTLYAGLTDFLATRPEHDLSFSPAETLEIHRLVEQHLERRWRALEHSFHRIAGLREAIRGIARPGELQDLLGHLDEWFTDESLRRIRCGIDAQGCGDVEHFLTSLREVADDFAGATVDISFISVQLKEDAPATAGGVRP